MIAYEKCTNALCNRQRKNRKIKKKRKVKRKLFYRNAVAKDSK